MILSIEADNLFTLTLEPEEVVKHIGDVAHVAQMYNIDHNTSPTHPTSIVVEKVVIEKDKRKFAGTLMINVGVQDALDKTPRGDDLDGPGFPDHSHPDHTDV